MIASEEALDTISASIWTSIGLTIVTIVLLWLYVRSRQNHKRVMSELNNLREILEEKEWMFRAVLDTVPAAINLKDERGRYKFVNKGLSELYGSSPEDAVQLWNRMQEDAEAGRESTVSIAKDPYNYKRSFAQDHQVLETGKRTEFADSVYDLNGRREIWSSSKLPMYDQRTGAKYVLTVSFNVTRQREMEEKLRQSQKMEAIGQLTGGVAHDFNNLLAVIIGNLELAEERLKEGDPLADHVRNSLRAAESGARLTHRLLAFARQQPLNPTVMNLNETIRDMHPLLTRSLGEQIEMEFVLDPDLWHCTADASQVENAILNLAINARDAMPDGGKLIVETSNIRLDEETATQNELTPGEFVMVAVTDNGIGMTPEVLRKAFEPFFTTKGVGKGSGLGLAMIYGFAKQSGGYAKIYSEEGRGTSVKIYLPRVREGLQEPKLQGASGSLPLGNGQTVLVVEDDDDVRALVVKNLTNLGYRVLAAKNGNAAVALADANPGFNLLLTDVILPGGMTGKQLSEKLRVKRPDLKTLFMSGYAANSIIHHGRVDPGVHLLQKPFGKKDLARALEKVLGN